MRQELKQRINRAGKKIVPIIPLLVLLVLSCNIKQGKNDSSKIELDRYVFEVGNLWELSDSTEDRHYIFSENNGLMKSSCRLEIQIIKDTPKPSYINQGFNDFLYHFRDNGKKIFSQKHFKGPYLNVERDCYGFRCNSADLYSIDNRNMLEGTELGKFWLAHRLDDMNTINIMLYCNDEKRFEDLESFFKEDCLKKIKYQW